MPCTARGCRPLAIGLVHSSIKRQEERLPYYTKHLVLSWNSRWLARGLNGLLGAAKRRILSFAEGPALPLLVPFGNDAEVDPFGGPLVTEAAEGIIQRKY